MELSRWKEKSEALEELLKSKTDLTNQLLIENSELKKKHDSLQLNFDDVNQVCLCTAANQLPN
jgi:hypothetical protein